MRWQPATLLILPVSASLLPVPPSGAILVVGASGGTGMLALQGMLDTGCAPSRLCVLSRNPSKPSLQPLVAQGVQVRWGDLDDPATLPAAVEGCSGCYVHSTTADTKKLDAGEVVRAQHLAAALKAAGVGQVVYNSFAAEPGHGVKRIEQKHAVEAVFSEEYGLVIVQPLTPDVTHPSRQFPRAQPATHLRANLFMDELWKKYTRPAILKGSFPFSLPPERMVHLTSVRDMGRLAAACLASPATTVGRKINVASEVLTPRQIAAAFAAAQGRPCVHTRNRLLYLLSRVLLPDLYEVLRFLHSSTEMTDVAALDAEFPELLTPFARFLEETRWGDDNLTYDDLSSPSSPGAGTPLVRFKSAEPFEDMWDLFAWMC